MIQRSVDWKTGAWLTAIPLSNQHFDLSPVEFRDALSPRYKRGLVQLPPVCDGCGGMFSIQHALDCRTGGLVIRRHNEIRDSLGDMCSLVYSDVSKEPVVRYADETGGALVGDLRVRGFWQPQVDCILDIRVNDTDAPSHINRPVRAVLASAEQKKRKYLDAVEFRRGKFRRGTFTPFVLSVDGVLGQAAEHFLKNLATTLAFKWDKSYSVG